jgi:hypothetical protein
MRRLRGTVATYETVKSQRKKGSHTEPQRS